MSGLGIAARTKTTLVLIRAALKAIGEAHRRQGGYGRIRTRGMSLAMHMTRPGRYGFDASRLARIDAFLKERYLDSGKLPHAQLLLARDGEIVHFSHQGAARAGGAPVDEGTLFRIASMTKPITSLAFMMLVEEAKVALDTPVHHVLPELKGI